MSRFLSSPTPSAPSHSGSAPLVTPPLLGSPAQSPYSETGPHDHQPYVNSSEAAGSSSSQPQRVPPRAGVLANAKSSSAAHTVPPPTAAVPVVAEVPRAPSSDDGHGTAHHGSIVPAYPYNVAMAPSAFVGGPLPDDSEVTTRLPSICVDYLSHDWAEDDVWTSWKAMTRHKTEIANGVRLENASWRTWAKQRGKLKTVSPETLNWLKDSDVTWLYGPLHTAVDAVPPPREATANERLGLESLRSLSDAKIKSGTTAAAPEVKKVELTRSASEQQSGTSSPSTAQTAAAAARANYAGGRGSPTLVAPTSSSSTSYTPAATARRKKPDFHAKPILKYRSLSDILMPHGQSTSPVLEATGMDFEDQATISVHHARSDSHLVRLNSLNRGKSGGSRRGSPIGSPMSSSPERTASDSSSGYATHARHSHHTAQKKKERRHISFNHRVEQCIAIDSSEDNRSSTYSTASSSDEDEDDVLTFGARSPRHSSFMRNAAAAQPKEPHTIARLGPTTLKSVEMYPAPSPAVVFSSDSTAYDPDSTPSSPQEGSYGQQLVEEADYGASAASGSSRGGSAGGAASGTSGQASQQQQQHAQAAAAGRRVIYDYSTAESQIRSQWDVDDEDYAMGFDYFTGPSGPDVGIGDEYDMAQYGSTHLIGGTHNNYGVGNGSGSDPYLSHGPYSPTSPYHPGTSTLEPSVHATATQMPHYRDALNAASNNNSGSSSSSSNDVRGDSSSDVRIAHGPHVPPASARDAGTPKKSALKGGGRSREASVESIASSTSPASSSAPSPPLSSVSTSPTGIQAIATAIPAHVRPGVVRRGTSEEGERGRSASRGSSSSLEREASAARRSSSASISPAAYSPPASVVTGGFGASSPPSAGSGAKPIAIEPTWKVAGSYESLDSVLSGSARGNGAAGASYFADRQGQDGNSSGAGAYGMGRIITSSSVDSMGSLGSFGNAPVTPTSPTFSSPTKRQPPPLPNPTGDDGDDDDDDKLVEDISTLEVNGAAGGQEKILPVQKVNSSSNVLAGATPTSTMNGPSTHAPSGSASAATVPVPDHVRVASGPRLRNPSPSATSPAVTSEQVPAQSLDARDSSDQDTSGGSSGLLKRTTSSSSLSFARQSLLRATRDRDESSPRSSIDSSDNDDYRAHVPHVAPAAPAPATVATADDLGVADGGVGSGINVAGTARDLLGALSKGIWGSLAGGNRQNSR
ncbi:hypothetical protein JCM10908_004693 [Rhodotorula pacifica]|uniref:GATA-like domain-containing protein n=1 Tax=Rhodotorula pacifica TaxID=1495444 RepID=UPI00316C5E51